METVRNFSRVHQQEGSLKIKGRYNMHIVSPSFGSGDLKVASQSPKKEAHPAEIETAMGGVIHCSGTT